MLLIIELFCWGKEASDSRVESGQGRLFGSWMQLRRRMLGLLGQQPTFAHQELVECLWSVEGSYCIIGPYLHLHTLKYHSMIRGEV